MGLDPIDTGELRDVSRLGCGEENGRRPARAEILNDRRSLSGSESISGSLPLSTGKATTERHKPGERQATGKGGWREKGTRGNAPPPLLSLGGSEQIVAHGTAWRFSEGREAASPVYAAPCYEHLALITLLGSPI
jgi:hypothetical protein